MVQALNFEKLCGAQDEVGGPSGQVYSFQLFLLAPFLTLPADDCLMYHDWYQHYRWVQVSQWITHNFFGSGASGINNSLCVVEGEQHQPWLGVDPSHSHQLAAGNG